MREAPWFCLAKYCWEFMSYLNFLMRYAVATTGFSVSPIQSLNAKGIAPRGRPGKQLERIEVDLSFLRSLDQSRLARVAAQRRFVISHVEMYRELSTILVEVMAKFQSVIEEIVGADTSDWS